MEVNADRKFIGRLLSVDKQMEGRRAKQCIILYVKVLEG